MAEMEEETVKVNHMRKQGDSCHDTPCASWLNSWRLKC